MWRMVTHLVLLDCLCGMYAYGVGALRHGACNAIPGVDVGTSSSLFMQCWRSLLRYTQPESSGWKP